MGSDSSPPPFIFHPIFLCTLLLKIPNPTIFISSYKSYMDIFCCSRAHWSWTQILSTCIHQSPVSTLVASVLNVQCTPFLCVPTLFSDPSILYYIDKMSAPHHTLRDRQSKLLEGAKIPWGSGGKPLGRFTVEAPWSWRLFSVSIVIEALYICVGS